MRLAEYKFRTRILPVILTLGFVIIFSRLVFLQIIKGGEYKSLADGNRIREELIHAPRGIIYDRNGYPLVRNIPGFRIREGGKIKIITREEALMFQVKGSQELEIDSLREYLYPEVFAHVIGYLGEGNAGNIVGKTGIEQKYNGVLTGVDGKRLIEVDANMQKLRVLGEIKPTPGQDIKTTLSRDLQLAAYEAMKDAEKGALVVTDPRTGEVLALVSKPSFSPNLFTLGKKGVDVQEILSDINNPLFNRTISGVYPPGSTFKIITAAAALENKVITADTKIEDVGILRIGEFSFPNWYFTQYGKTEGQIDIVKALKRSNDIFFYKIAAMVGLDDLNTMAKKFGLDSILGIDLQGEAAGLFPSSEWKIKNVGDKWYLGDTYHLGIGQGYLLVTPLQMNAWTAVIANGGTLYQPRLVKNYPITQLSNKQSLRSNELNPIVKNQKFLKEETIELIREGMRQACSPGGTGWPLFNFKVSVACKTGTAEFGDSKNRTHAWFTIFAPIEDPQIVVTVLAEGAGEGSNVAAPIAKKVLETYFAER